MIPAWIMPLLSTTGVGEFSYNDKYRISIKGKFLNGEWVVDVYVNAIPYFVWGCNKFYTGMKGSFEEVITHYSTIVLKQLSEYNINI